MLSQVATVCRFALFIVSLSAFSQGSLSRTPGADGGADIYVIDVEGGAATLILTPARQAILIDGGWNTPNLRDSRRILAVAKAAGVDRLDYVIVSHFHSDHLGGVVELAQQIPITEFIDRGPIGTLPPYVSQDLYSQYMKLAGQRRRIAKPGERINLKAQPGEPATSLLILASGGQTVQRAAGTPNPECAAAHAGPVDEGENANSVAVLFEYGSFRYLDAADLTWPVEAQLVCPSNQIGHVNVYQVDHHGKSTSNNPVLLASIHADAAVMNNGSHKGGDASVVANLRRVMEPGNVYQVHRNLATSAADNVAETNIANPGSVDGGFGFHVHVDANGKSYQIINGRTAKAIRYPR